MTTENQLTSVEVPVVSEPANVREDVAQETVAAAPISLWMGVVIAVLVSILVTVIAFAAYLQFGPKPSRIVTVDITEIMQIKQLQITAMATKPGVTDREREAAYDEISAFGRSLEGAIGSLQQECNCIVLVRAAVVKGAEDATEALKQKVGIGNITLVQAMSLLKSAPATPSPAIPAGGAMSPANPASLFTNPNSNVPR